MITKTEPFNETHRVPPGAKTKLPVKAVSQMRFYLSLYLCITGFYLLTWSGRIGRMSDSTAMFRVAESMINQHSLSSEPCDPRYDDPEIGSTCIPGRDGRFYASYGFVPSLAVVPAILGARVFSGFVHVDSALVAKASASLFTLLVAPLSCVVLAMWILRLRYSSRTAVLGACVLAFGSPFWHNSVSGLLTEPYFTLALLIAAYLLSSPRTAFACALSGFAFGAACGTRVAGVALFPAFILGLAAQARLRRLSWAQFARDSIVFSAPVVLWGVLIGWTNYIRFGSIFDTGYQVAFPTASFTFSNPLFQGIRELLFHGQVGLVWFAPWVLLALIWFPRFLHIHRAEAVLCGAVFLINFVFYAKFYAWHGGWAGGPRYLIPALPFLIMMMAPGLEALQRRAVPSENQGFRSFQRSIAVALLAAGFIIQVVTVPYPRDRYYADLIFYAHRSQKPWWYNSIPFAAVNYWFDTSIPKTEASYSEPDETRTGAVKRDSDSDSDPLSYWKEANAVSTESAFINWLPHPENAVLPELMLLKRKLIGLPPKALWIYITVVLALLTTGIIGVRRCIVTRDLASPSLDQAID